MKQCLYCSGKLETMREGFNQGQPRCVECRAIFNIVKTKKKDYECDDNGNKK